MEDLKKKMRNLLHGSIGMKWRSAMTPEMEKKNEKKEERLEEILQALLTSCEEAHKEVVYQRENDGRETTVVEDRLHRVYLSLKNGGKPSDYE